MPSLQSHLFRPLTRLLAARLDTIPEVAQLRTFMAMGPQHPLLPRGVTAQPATANGVSVEWLTPTDAAPARIVLYFHGGGWTLGWYNSHRWLVAQLAQAAAARALAVDYRLAPEHPFPAALDDCVAAYRWLLQTGHAPHHIVIAGDSSGGNLTLTTLMVLREAGDPLPAAAVCLSPMTDLEGTGPTFHTNQDAALKARFALSLARNYIGASAPRTPLISPYYGSLQGFPPLLIHVGAEEILRSDAERLATQGHAAGVDTTLVIWPGMWHVWHVFAPYLPEAAQAVQAIGAFVQAQTTKKI